MNSRLPVYFQLQKYGITPEDIVKTMLRCDPDAVQEKVVVTPAWRADIFKKQIERLRQGRVISF